MIDYTKLPKEALEIMMSDRQDRIEQIDEEMRSVVRARRTVVDDYNMILRAMLTVTGQ